MNRIMAVCDADPFYAGRFADYANQKERIPFAVISFSTAERLWHYLEQQNAEILLLGDTAQEPHRYKPQVKQIITLNDGCLSTQFAQYPTIYKFQSADNILREVMALYESEPGMPAGGTTMSRCTVAGIFSPVNRCGKTAFSVTYAQTLAKENRTLYVNLEDCSGFLELLPHEGQGDFSDVLYYFRHNMLSQTKLGSVIHPAGEMDYIPPARYPEDLFETDGDELMAVLKHIAAEGGYQTLVVDLGTLGKLAAQILGICDVIFMPVLEDAVSSAKIAEFEKYLEVSRQLAVAERIHKLSLPAARFTGTGSSWLEQLLWGEMGDYVRRMVKGGEPSWQ